MLNKEHKIALIYLELFFECLVAGRSRLDAATARQQGIERLKEYERTMTYDEFITYIADVLEQLYEFMQARPELAKKRSEAIWRSFTFVANENSREYQLISINTKFWKLMYKAVYGVDQDHVVE